MDSYAALVAPQYIRPQRSPPDLRTRTRARRSNTKDDLIRTSPFVANPSATRGPAPAPVPVRAPRTSPPFLLVFFILLSFNCFLSLPSFSSSLFSVSSLIHSCDAAAYNLVSNQRVDAPSPEDFPPLTGSDYAFTQSTPLGSLIDARQYVDGALATQRLIAAPIIPLDRQSWVGVDTRTAYFGNNFGGDKIAKIPELLQAGMRRLVIDLWWDDTDLGWQLCPRIKRDGTQLSALRAALEQGRENGGVSEQLQRMGSHQAVEEEVSRRPLLDLDADLDLDAVQTPALPVSPALPTSLLSTQSSTSTTTPFDQKPNHEQKRHLNPIDTQADEYLEKRAAANTEETGFGKTRDRHLRSAHHDSQSIKAKTEHPSTRPEKNKGSDTKEPQGGNPPRQRTRQNAREWYRKKKPHQRPAIKPKGLGAIQAPRAKEDNKTASGVEQDSRIELKSSLEQRGRLHRLAMSKGLVSSYNQSNAIDKTVDGITCSTGEDVVMLLQALQSWIQQTTESELEDVLLIVLNLNQLGNNSLGSRLPSGSPTPTPPINGTNTTIIPVSDEDFFKALVSPNTNKTIKALLPNMISLRELFMDAFPSLIYSPAQLQTDRMDLRSTWWSDSRVGLDYYNTTTDPATGKIQAPTGWPTSSYLTEVIKRRIVIGIGANNLQTNTSYNITDDFTTLYEPGILGPSMTNSSLLRISSAFASDQCDYPVPGVMMTRTGSEENTTRITDGRNSSGPITMNVTWSFSSVSDGDLLPWSFTSGQLATNCGFSALVEGRTPVLSFAEHAGMTIWSWDLDQPPSSKKRSRDQRCGAMQSNGRWIVQNCNLKLPVACRQINSSSKWIIFDRGAGNYRDLWCPDGYMFDVPRTARENQLLYSTLLTYWNETASSSYASPMSRQKRAQKEDKLARGINPFRTLLDKLAAAGKHQKRDHYGDDGSDDNEGKGEEDRKGWSPSFGSSLTSMPRRGNKAASSDDGDNKESSLDMRQAMELSPPSTPIAGAPDGGMIWIDISSWQTAGCWVPGGVHGICPYQDPDNTVALQEIIKVSTIGGVIILGLVGIFLYLKCRRNVRLRKANKRRAVVRNKIMRTEVETVPA